MSETVNIIQPIGWYETLNEQRARLGDCERGSGIPHPLVPNNTLFPFIHNLGVVTEINLVCVGSGGESDLVPTMELDENSDFIYYDGESVLRIYPDVASITAFDTILTYLVITVDTPAKFATGQQVLVANASAGSEAANGLHTIASKDGNNLITTTVLSLSGAATGDAYNATTSYNIPEGIYYLHVVLDGVDYYSDWFEVFDVAAHDYMMVEYSDTGFVGNFEYPADYLNRVWLDAKIRRPTYVLEREARLDGDDNPFYSRQKWEKRLAFDARVTEPTVDALTQLPLHNTVDVHYSGIEYLNVDDIVFDEPEWFEELSCIADMRVSFSIRRIIKRICEIGGVPAMPPTPEAPTTTYSIAFDIRNECPDGKLIPGATIRIYDGVDVDITQTSTLFSGLLPGTYDYEINADGYDEAIGDVTIVNANVVECVALTFDATLEVGDEWGGGMIFDIDGSDIYIVAKFDLGSGGDLTWQESINEANLLIWAGKSDWRMPTLAELADIRTNIYLDAGFNAIAEIQDDYYWSATETGYTTANRIQMPGGSQSSEPKSNGHKARAIRVETV